MAKCSRSLFLGDGVQYFRSRLLAQQKGRGGRDPRWRGVAADDVREPAFRHDTDVLKPIPTNRVAL